MPQTRPNFDPATGDDTTGALRKLDNNCVDLDTRVTAARTAATTAQATADGATGTANAAAPKASPIFTGTPRFSGTPNLEGTAGATRILWETQVTDADDDRIQLLATRSSAGANWTTVTYRLRRIVNGSQQGIIEFGVPTSNTGVTIDGGKPWTTANTTVDGNNFIKRV